jgi:hypothetical protein
VVGLRKVGHCPLWVAPCTVQVGGWLDPRSGMTPSVGEPTQQGVWTQEVGGVRVARCGEPTQRSKESPPDAGGYHQRGHNPLIGGHACSIAPAGGAKRFWRHQVVCVHDVTLRGATVMAISPRPAPFSAGSENSNAN